MAPDTEPVFLTNATRKRRQSEEEEQNTGSKKPRLSPVEEPPKLPESRAVGEQDASLKAPTKQQDSEERGGGRRKSNTRVDEKQRSKRLFGALLSNLNQPKRDTKAKKRQDNLERHKAELRMKDGGHSQDTHRHLELLVECRKREQRTFEKEKMRAKHSNMLDRANFLQTKTEPRLYYRPWDLRLHEEDRIDLQKRETRTKVDRELDEFFESKQKLDDVPALPASTKELETTKSINPNQLTDANQLVMDDGPESQGQVKSDTNTESKAPAVPDTDSCLVDDTSAEQETTAPDSPTQSGDTKKQEEAEADHVVEGGAEDDVIY
ncbi:Hypothetical protein R9X50_00584300 [Acrodontium crateriforme]|uniref:Pinin/SDK/MemA protein domain-containing protein n=1 Tax=Acrodontium crateriforme TaxID=150365 RepID=A0AAQ3RB96_9PEZI|nr:Hypothetical protein R9X50_00584300 [Acrodontium crateriforme]